MNRCRKHVLAIASISVGLVSAAPAHAGTYAKVNQSDWQQGVTGLPTYVNMYLYLPTTPASKPPIVVFPHQCTGTAGGSHGSQGSLEKIADTSGFIIIYPEATGQNCWDAGSTRSLKHGGGGDTGAIVQMVKYTVSKHNADPNRVYSTGPSSGGIMTEALLGVYPDVFMGGISMMGVPCGCWASGYNDTVGKGSTDQWAGPCASGTVTHTGKEWGDLVRSYFPEYGNKHRPRLQHWHGAKDTLLSYKNVAEDIKEWTNLLGLSETPTGTEQNGGTTRQFWKNSCFTVYETFVLADAAHSVSVDANTITKYFGLDKAGTEDPETAACPGAVPGGGGSSTGTGGASGAGGGTGAGGATGTGDGGPGGRDGGGREGGPPGSGGVQATGGSPGSGGAVESGGRSGSGGAQASGGVVASGGTGAKAGASGSGGAVGSGGSTVGTGGSVGSGGEGQGGKQANGGSTTPSGSSGGSVTTASNASGSGCAIGGRAGHSASALAVLLLAAVALIFRRQRRARR